MSLASLDRRVHLAIAAFIATGFFVVMSLAFIGTEALNAEGAGIHDDFDRLADAIFVDHVIALEALGILLTAALIGAMVIARPLGSQPDSINYATKRDAKGLAEVQLVSDVRRNLGDHGFDTPVYTDINADSEEEE